MLAACGGGGGGGPQNALPAAPRQPGDVTASVALSSAGTAQNLPAVSGIHTSITLPANNAPSGKLNVTLSTTATSQDPQIPAGNAQAFLYVAMATSSDVTLNGSPKVAMTLPQAPKSQGQFYAWLYDVSSKSWLNLAPITVQGAQMTFGGTNKTLTMKQGAQYLIIPFTAEQFISCPTPGPTPTPSPTPTPTPPPAISGKWFDAITDTNGNNAAFNTFDEQTGKQLATLNLGYPNGVFGAAIALSKSGSLAYIAGYGPLVNGNPSTFPLPGLTIVDTASNSVIHQTTIDGGIDAGTLSPDETRYYGVGEDVNGNEFFVFDASTGALLKTVSLPTQIFGVTVNPAGTTAYLPADNQIYTVNLTSGTLATLCMGCAGSLAFNVSGTKLFSVQQAGILILNPSTGAQIGTIAKPPNVYIIFQPAPYARFEAGNLASFVIAEGNNDGSYSYAVVSTASDSILNTFTAPPYFGGDTPAVNEAGTYAVFMNSGSGSASPVGALALPYGQEYFFQFMSTSNSYDSDAAQ
jgi:hypothetical protein